MSDAPPLKGQQLNDTLYGLVTSLSRSLGAASSSRGVDGVATASVTMLSKMISKYEMTKVFEAQFHSCKNT